MGIEFIRRKLRGTHGLILLIGTLAALMLLPLFAMGAYHVSRISPDQFVKEFQEAQSRH